MPFIKLYSDDITISGMNSWLCVWQQHWKLYTFSFVYFISFSWRVYSFSIYTKEVLFLSWLIYGCFFYRINRNNLRIWDGMIGFIDSAVTHRKRTCLFSFLTTAVFCCLNCLRRNQQIHRTLIGILLVSSCVSQCSQS